MIDSPVIIKQEESIWNRNDMYAISEPNRRTEQKKKAFFLKEIVGIRTSIFVRSRSKHSKFVDETVLEEKTQLQGYEDLDMYMR